MRKKYILCYHHLMIFIFLFILMTKKNTIILIAIVYIIIAVWLLTSNTNVKKEPTAYDICHWTWYWFEVQVTACGDIIKQAQYNYKHTVDLLSWYSNTASWARERIREVAKQFYDNNLSGTNVDFQ